jgi:hypothetical protein
MAKITRRDFIKKTSLSAAGISVLSIAPWASAQAKSRVVIARDTTCGTTTADAAKVQEMVDQAIMALTGIQNKGLAYEALFPTNGVTTSTKIVIKINQAKRNTISSSYDAVTAALTKGLGYMLGGTFPTANVTIVGTDSGAASATTFQVGATMYTVRNTWVNCNYFINCPPCYAIDAGCGAAMSLKNMITSFSSPTIGSMHSTFTNATTPSLAILNSQPLFKQKQVLTLMNAIIISPTGTSTAAGYSVIASKDMVAVDYQGIQMLIAGTGFSAANQTAALKVCELAAGAPYSIGTNLPDNMEVLRISPPYATQIISSGSPLSSNPEIITRTEGNRTVFEYKYGQRKNVGLAVYDMSGRQVCSRKESGTSIVWAHNDLNGSRVSAGAYLYTLKIGDIYARGTVVVKK